MRWQIVAALIIGIGVGQWIPPLTAQVREIKTTTLLSADLGSWCDGKEVTIEFNDVSPGMSGKHYHPAHSFSWIIDGTETYQVEGNTPRTVKAGDLLHETPRQVHTVENQAPVRLLVMRIAEKGKPATVRVP